MTISILKFLIVAIILVTVVYFALALPILMILDCARNGSLSPLKKTVWLVFSTLLFPLGSFCYGLVHSSSHRISSFIGLLIVVIAVIYKFNHV